MNTEKDDCPVCLIPLEEEYAVLYACRHIFCMKCTEKFVLSNPTCPLDRGNILSIKCCDPDGDEMFQRDLDVFTKCLLKELVGRLVNKHLENLEEIVTILRDVRDYYNRMQEFSDKMEEEICQGKDLRVWKEEYEGIKRQYSESIQCYDFRDETMRRKNKTTTEAVDDINLKLNHLEKKGNGEGLNGQLKHVIISSFLEYNICMILGGIKDVIRRINDVFECGTDKNYGITSIIEYSQYFLRRLPLLMCMCDEIFKMKRAHFLEYEGITNSLFRSYYIDSEERCIICGEDLMELNCTLFVNCQHGICAPCSNSHTILKPKCPFNCHVKNDEVICRNDGRDYDKAVAVEDFDLEMAVVEIVHHYLDCIKFFIKFFCDIRRNIISEMDHSKSEVTRKRCSLMEAYQTLISLSSNILRKIINTSLIKNNDVVKLDYRLMKLQTLFMRHDLTTLGNIVIRICSNIVSVEKIIVTDMKRWVQRLTECKRKLSTGSIAVFPDYDQILARSATKRCLLMISEDVSQIRTKISNLNVTNKMVCERECTDLLRYINVYVEELRINNASEGQDTDP